VDTNPTEHFHLAGGVSSLRGTGFHPGTDATKSTVNWTDTNDDGVVSVPELAPQRPQDALPSQNFDRWAVGADLRMQFETSVGVTKVYGEFLLGSNMDRGQ